MINADNEDKPTNILMKFFNKIISISLILISISLFMIMFSFNADDTGWGIVSDKTPLNLYKEFGAWIASFIIRGLGIFTGFLMTLVCLIWSLKLFNKTSIYAFRLKIIGFISMIIFSIPGGAYLEKIISTYFRLYFDIINQNGFPQTVLYYLSNQANFIFKHFFNIHYFFYMGNIFKLKRKKTFYISYKAFYSAFDLDFNYSF